MDAVRACNRVSTAENATATVAVGPPACQTKMAYTTVSAKVVELPVAVNPAPLNSKMISTTAEPASCAAVTVKNVKTTSATAEKSKLTIIIAITSIVAMTMIHSIIAEVVAIHALKAIHIAPTASVIAVTMDYPPARKSKENATSISIMASLKMVHLLSAGNVAIYVLQIQTV